MRADANTRTRRWIGWTGELIHLAKKTPALASFLPTGLAVYLTILHAERGYSYHYIG